MSLLLQRLFNSLANGSVYGALGVSIAVVFRSTGVLNLAQGQMAMFSTYLAMLFVSEPGPAVAFSGWVDDFGTPWPLWAAMIVAVVISAGMGAVVERLIIRPLDPTNPVPLVGMTLSLFLFLNVFVNEHWSRRTRFIGSPFPQGVDARVDIGGARLWLDTVGIAATMTLVLLALYVLQRQTRLGLAYRAVTSNRESAELSGVRVQRVIMGGWMIAAMVGAVAGTLIAGEINVRPDMMSRLFIFGLAAATLGGLTSPGLAFVGGYAFAFAETMLSGYVDFIDSQVTLVWCLGVVVVVLAVRPSGLQRRRNDVVQNL